MVSEGYVSFDKGLMVLIFSGIARYCMKTPSFADARRDMEERGYKIYIDEQRGMQASREHYWLLT